jgi:GDP-L-fucose synthase
LAAIVGGRLKIEGDPLAVATDLSIDAEFFNWCVKAKPKKIVYFSSSAVYPIGMQGRTGYCKLSESFTNFDGTRIGVPDFTYGWAKLTGEYLAKQAVEKYGLDVVVYRPFSGYGEDQSFDYPFPSIVKRVVHGENPITIWGSGDQTRDFIHIDDIVECVLQTMDVLKPGEVLNLGSGISTSFKDLVHLATQLVCHETKVRKTIGIECDTSKPEGVFYRVADTWKMNQFYKPKVSLEEGIKRVATHLTKLGK